MKTNKALIRTSDEETKKILEAEGLTLVCKEGSFWLFINDNSKVNFSQKIDTSKITYTNKLSM